MRTKKEIKVEFNRSGLLKKENLSNKWIDGYWCALQWVLNKPIVLKSVLTKKGLKKLGGAKKLNITDFILKDTKINYENIS